MRINAFAKVNWALAVTGTRPDGYHTLDMAVTSISLCDTLQLRPYKNLVFSVNMGTRVPQGADNLVLRAARGLQESLMTAEGARIELTKRIPIGAGLGGGSADAAATLSGLMTLWKRTLPRDELFALGLSLGADVPFCLLGGAARVTGVGEVLSPFAMPKSFHLLVCQPCAGMSTQEAFGAYDRLPVKPENPDIAGTVAALQSGNPRQLAQAMGNALLPATLPVRPEIRRATDMLKDLGALNAQMTGSGSAVIGLFDSQELAQNAFPLMEKVYPRTFVANTRTD